MLYLLAKDHPAFDESFRKCHCVLDMYVVIRSAVDHHQTVVPKQVGLESQVGLLVPVVVVLGGGQAHVALSVGRI